MYELPAPRDTAGHEQRGARYGIVVQSDDLEWLSTWLVVPTSTSAAAFSWRPEVTVLGKTTRALTEHTVGLSPQRLGHLVGFLPLVEMQEVDRALRLALGLG